MSKATERNGTLAASSSANSLDRAAQHLETALSELAEAHAAAAATNHGLDNREERALQEQVVKAFAGHATDGSLINAIRDLRDRRAARAGFSFDDED